MSDKICLPTEYYMLLMLFCISLTLFYIYKMQNIDFKLDLNNNLDILSKQMNMLNDVPIMTRPYKKERKTIGDIDYEKRDYLEDRDQQAVFNEFKPYLL